jgi:hypothetical protein
MPRFIAAHTMPMTEEQLQALAQKAAPPEVRWIRTFCGFDDNKHFCEWEAPNKEAVKEVLSQESIPYDGVYRVRIFDVASRTLEA